MALPFSQLSKGSSGFSWAASDVESRPFDPRQILAEKTPPLVLEPLDTSSPIPDHEINKRAFYSTMLEDDAENFTNNYVQTEAELKISGESPLYNKHKAEWDEEQTFNLEGDVNNILLDPTVDTNTKLKVLERFKNGELLSDDLEDKYRQRSANQVHDTKEDTTSQDLMLETTINVIQKHREVEQARQDAMMVESDNNQYWDLALGLVRDLVPGVVTFDNWYYRQKLAEHLGESWKDHSLQSVTMIGSTNQEIGQMMDSILSPEHKMEFMQAIIDTNSPIPGTSYNKWSALQDKINQGQMGPVETWIENFFGAVDLIGVGKILKNPIRSFNNLRHFKLYSPEEKALYNKLFLPQNLNKIGKVPSPEEIAKLKESEVAAIKTQNEKASNPPTGTGVKVRTVKEYDELIASAEAEKKNNPDAWTDVDERMLEGSKLNRDTMLKAELTPAMRKEKKRLESLGLPDDVILATLGKERAKPKGDQTTRINELERNIAGLEKAKSDNPSGFGKFHEKSLMKQKAELRDIRANQELMSDPIRVQKKIEELQDSIRTVERTRDFEPQLWNAHQQRLLKDLQEELAGLMGGTQPVVPPSQLIGIGAQPTISPASPLGVTQTVNPTKTRELATQAILDPNVARATGTTPGEVVGSFALEKLDDDFLKNNPDISAELEKWDRKFNKRYDDTKLDPYLTDTVERTADKDKIYRTFQETQGAYYQASNSTMEESLGQISGRARFGRNADFGVTSHDDALQLEKNIQDSFPGNKTTIVQENGQFYVDMDWKKEYDPFSARTFGIESTDARFLGIPLGGLARGKLAPWLLPVTSRLAEWVPKGAFLSEVQGLKTQELFGKLQKEIRNTKYKNELNEIIHSVSETQVYLKESDIASKFPHLREEARKELMGKQYLWKRLSDYTHNITNRLERERLIGEGKQGIWQGDKHLGNGKVADQMPVSVSEVWDFDLGIAIRKPSDLQGKQFVKLDEAMSAGNNRYEYAIVGGTSRLDVLPSIVVPKIEGYVPRTNIESWYVRAHPKALKINGEAVSDVNVLRDKHTRTIGAAKDTKDAQKLVEKLQKELGDDFVVSYTRERTDVGDAILTDFKVYKEKTDYGKTRGDRLPTIDGFARLEDPFVAADKRIKTLARLDAWRQYDEVFKTNFMRRFSAFLTTGEFPNTLLDLKFPKFATEDVAKSFNVAQRLFEQYSNSKYKLNQSDVVWKTVGHKLADMLEGFYNNIPSEMIRNVANKGDIFRRGLGSLSTNLFINLSPAAQWIVQTQVVLPFAMMEKGFRDTMHMLPGLYVDMLSRARDAGPYKDIIKYTSKKVAGEPTEFQKIADAIYDSGLPQGVDLNMMLHGALDDISKPLVNGFGGKVIDVPGQVIKKPGQFGKAVGYTPAQMMADMSGFLFAKARWEKMNPGKNWNTPTNIRQIAADGWDIMGSMTSRAGAMPYQDGYLGELFRFQAVLHKNTATIFTGKTLKKAPGEIIDPKVKYAAANMVAFGIYGVPAGTAVYNLWDMWFGDETDPETLATYEQYKGGLVDLVTNGTIELFLADSKAPPLDLAISKRIGPMPDTLPYVDLGWTLYKFMTGNKTDNPRFPFVNSVGSIWNAVGDANNILSATPEYNTVEALMVWGRELAEATSGFNNFAKAMAISEFDDKKNKFGAHHGLELTRSHMIAQIFGITSQKEVDLYAMMENKKEREDYIEDRATKILSNMEMLKDKIGTNDWTEYVRRVKVLNAGTHERVRDEVAERVMQKDRANYLTTRESMMKYLATHYKGQHDKNLNQMMASFKNGTPKEQEFIKFLERNFNRVPTE